MRVREGRLGEIWWVNQGQSYKWESQLGVLWAPNANGSGRRQDHWDRMDSVAAGDLVLHYAAAQVRAISTVLVPARRAPNPHLGKTESEWQLDGREIKVRVQELDLPLNLASIPEDLRKSWKRTGSPFNVNGGVNQGYLWELPVEAGIWIVRALRLVVDTEGPSAAASTDDASGDFDTVISVGPDGEVTVKTRPEHGQLKRMLFNGAPQASCSLCGRVLPTGLLVVSHIKKRSECSLKERGDLNVVMAACALGCDAVFERGYVHVQSEGTIKAGPWTAPTDSLLHFVEALEGRKIAGFTESKATYFEWHARWHGRRAGN